MQGFQLWLNLPASEKMKPAAYVDIAPERITQQQLPQGTVKVIAGVLQTADLELGGPIQGLSTDPQYYDIALDAGQSLSLQLPATHNALVYPYRASVHVTDGTARRQIPEHHAAVLTQGNSLTLQAEHSCRLLVLAAAAIGEPIVQYGPFVMNSVAEIEQAISDYQQGKLTDNTAAGSIALS